MARPLRVEYPGAHYHVMSRSIRKEKIYRTPPDREKFLSYLGKATKLFSISIHTYCLMDTHYHLLVETPYANLGPAMQWINVSYAMFFNRRLGRHGHLFQGRYKAILIEADAYLKHLSRYIHLNPVRAKMVTRPGDYHWSSYCAYIGKKHAPEFLVTDKLLKQFGHRKKEAFQNYRNFVENAYDTDIENHSLQPVEGFLLGTGDFVNWVKANFLADKEGDKEIPQLRKLKPRATVDSIIQHVAKEFDCNADSITVKGRKRNKAREVAIYVAKNTTGISCSRLGQHFGEISGAAISTMSKRIEKEKEQNKELNRLIEKIKTNI